MLRLRLPCLEALFFTVQYLTCIILRVEPFSESHHDASVYEIIPSSVVKADVPLITDCVVHRSYFETILTTNWSKNHFSNSNMRSKILFQ